MMAVIFAAMLLAYVLAELRRPRAAVAAVLPAAAVAWVRISD